MSPPPDIALDAAWLHRLARQLAPDGAAADDLSQDTWVARFAQREPVGRAWLGTVLRNLGVTQRRTDVRRARREAAVARPEAQAGTADVVELIETRTRVLTAVRALDEPYRSAIVLRYLEDLAPREIARRTQVPVRTVHTRLHRGLGMLRARLDGEFGDRRAWLAAILLPVPALRTSTLGPAAVMTTKSKLIAVGVACALAVLTLTWRSGQVEPEAKPVDLAPRNAEGFVGSPGSPTIDAAPARTPAESAPPPIGIDPSFGLWSANMVPATIAFGGRVVDLENRGVRDVRVTYDDFSGRITEPPIVTDAEGNFAATRPAVMGHVRVDDPHWVTVLEPHIFDSDQLHTELTIVVAPAAELTGLVQDDRGNRVAECTVSVTHGIDLRAAIPRVLDRAVDVEFRAVSDAGGRFAIPAVPATDGAMVSAQARGHAPASLSLRQVLRGEPIVLTRTTEGDDLEGRVVGPDGAPVAGARVTLRNLWVSTDAEGRFVLALWRVESEPPPGTPVEIRAEAPQQIPTRVTGEPEHWRTRAAWPADLTLRLGGPAPRIRGRVLHADGSPVVNPSWAFLDPQPEFIVDAFLDEPEIAFGIANTTVDGSHGEFETFCVPPGRYRLRVTDPQTLDVIDTRPIEAGSDDLVIRMPDRGTWPALHGVVVDRRGAPVAGADWLVERDDPAHGVTPSIQGGWHNASPEGVIEHPPLSRDVHTLCVKAAGMAEWHRFRITELTPASDFRAVVPVGCQARIELGAAWNQVSSAQLVDLSGATSPVVITHGDVAWGTRTIPVTDGRSQTFVALDDCVELLLMRGEEILRRIPVSLHRGEMNVLRP